MEEYKRKKVMLMILDGWGIGQEYEGNAILKANTPNMDLILKNFPNTTLTASGRFVGLPSGQMGNSEVGHLNIGSGRIIYQDYAKINKDIENGKFFKNEILLKTIRNVKEKKKALHIMGLVSFGGVHSHFDHLVSILEMCKKEDLNNVYIHAFLDGRDVSPNSGIKDIEVLEKKLKSLGIGKILSVSGRYYGMDRDKRWDRIKLAYDAIVKREGEKAETSLEAIKKSYSNDITDEFIKPTVITKNLDLKKKQNIEDGDSILSFNFRADRVREITEAFINPDFDKFETIKFKNLDFVSMTEYDKNFKNVKNAYPTEEIKDTLGEVIEKNNLTQFRIAETEKYPHITFFFDGGVEEKHKGEERVVIPSPKVTTYDLKPEMSSDEVAKTVIDKINENKYDLIVLNFANPDMVGHTAIMDAAIKAVERIDMHVGNIAEATIKNDYTLLITADHGNIEKLIDYRTKEPFTAHTTNLVPFIVVSREKKNIKLKRAGSLQDIAPTILDILDIKKPELMTGNSLIEK